MADSNSADKPVLEELAAANDAVDFGLFLVGELRAPTDEILTANGRGDFKLYRQLLRDDQVHSCWQQRRRAVIAREWFVEPGGPSAQDKAAADFLRETLQHLRWDNLSLKMLSGIWYGYAVAECMWAAEGGRIVLDAVKVRPASRFRWDRDGGLRVLTKDAPFTGVPLPERKFWTYATGVEDDDDPYGRGLAYHCYWPVWMKRNAARLWGVFLEKFAIPTALGSAPRGATETERKKALAVLRAATRDSAVIVPEGFEVKYLEAGKQAGADFNAFMAYWDAALAKVILSQTMTTENGGSLAQAQVHQDVKLEVVKADNDLVCESFNDGPARWLTEWNFPGAKPPRVWRDHSEPEDLKARADRDAIIHGMGYDLTPEYVAETYGPGFVQRGGPSLTGLDRATAPGALPLATTDFAEPEPGPVDALVDQLGQAAAGPMGDMTAALAELLDEAANLEDYRRLLLEKGLLVPVDALAHPIAQAIALADLTGRSDILAGPQ